MTKHNPSPLRDWRHRNRLTQAKAAQRLGFSQSLYSKYETGQRVPVKVETIRRIRAITRIPVRVLVGVQGGF